MRWEVGGGGGGGGVGRSDKKIVLRKICFGFLKRFKD